MKTLNKILLLLLIVQLTSCINENECITGSGTKITKELAVPTFSKFTSYGNHNIVVTQGNTQKILVSGYPNIISELKRGVANGHWKMAFEDYDCYGNSDLDIQITIPNIEEANLVGTGKVTIHNFSNNNKELRLNLSGSGDFEIYENSGTEELNITIDGSGNLFAHKDFINLKNLHVAIRGSGDVNAFPLHTENANIKIIGSGHGNIYVKSLLDITIDGSGIIYYKGNPTISQTILGSGKLINTN